MKLLSLFQMKDILKLCFKINKYRAKEREMQLKMITEKIVSSSYLILL